MDNKTRQLFTAYTNRLAELNGIGDATTQFNIAPSVQQILEDKIRESSAFLKTVNTLMVDELKGEKIGLDSSNPAASRTDTSGSKKRETRNLVELDRQKYELFKTNFDTHITYAQLDLWARFPDFQNRITNMIARQIARDRLMIGWHGTSAADTTNIQSSPKLEDVNIGWLQQIVSNAPDHKDDTGLKVGSLEGKDFKTIDAAVYDAAHSYISDWHIDDTRLVCIAGKDLLVDKHTALIDNYNEPTERAALDTIIANKKLGGFRTIIVPFFPARAFLVTRLDNLSIYSQTGKHRRHVQDNPGQDRVDNFQSSNEGYVIEDYSAVAFVKNIQIPVEGSWG